jgi:signal transduction histidine kinase
MLSNTPNAFLVGEGDSFIYASPGAVRMLRYNSTEELLNLDSNMGVVHADDAVRVKALWDEAREQSAAKDTPVPVTITFRGLCKDGAHVWLESSVCVEPARFYAVFRCASSQTLQLLPQLLAYNTRPLEQRCQRPQAAGGTCDVRRSSVLKTRSAQEGVQQASLKTFLASMMYEIRTPLTGVLAAAQLLAQRPCVSRDEENSFLVAAISAACHMLMVCLQCLQKSVSLASCGSLVACETQGIVDNVLSLRSMEAGECRIAEAPFSIRAVVGDVLGICRMSLAHRANVDISWTDGADGDLPALVLGDAGKLSQILLNLLTSAHTVDTRVLAIPPV